jgi:error-prone DNA polymerase
VAEREREPFTSLADLSRRVPLTREQLEALATAGALRAWGSRRENLWSAGALAHEHGVVHGTWLQPPLPGTAVGARPPALPGMDVVEEAVADVWATGVTPHTFPTRFRPPPAGGVRGGGDRGAREGGSRERLRVGGVVTHRQRPKTASGITFLSLEDETGLLNVVCSVGLWQRYRRVARTSAALVVRGTLERADVVTNLVADALEPLSLAVPSRSRDFR